MEEDFVSQLSWLNTLISRNAKAIKESPGLSATQRKLLDERNDLVRQYFEVYSQMVETNGVTKVVRNKITFDKTVPPEIKQAISLLSDPATADRTAEIFAPKIPRGMGASEARQRMTDFWSVPVSKQELKVASTVSGRPKTTTGGQPAPTGPATPTTPTTGRGATTVGGQAPPPPPGPKKLKAEEVLRRFRQMFPSQAWLTEIDQAKYPGLAKVLRSAVEGKMGESPEGLARFDALYRGSDFYKELQSNNTIRTIKGLVGDLGFDSKPFESFLKDAINFGWKDDTLRQEVYREAFRRDDATGEFVNRTAAERVKKSAPYLQVQNIGRAYFNTVGDATVENVLTGGMNVEDVSRQQREFAKTKYGHLSNLIDQGLTLQDISDPFRRQAADLLERSVDDIDMSSADFETAFSFGEEGKKRLMTTGEWRRAIRTNGAFGWDKTENAKREARQIASSIVQAFGKVI